MSVMLRPTLAMTLLAACATAQVAPGPEHRPPDMVIAGAVEVGDLSGATDVAGANYADCMVQCRGLCDPFAVPGSPTSSPTSSVGLYPHSSQCEALASDCRWDCWHRYYGSR